MRDGERNGRLIPSRITHAKALTSTLCLADPSSDPTDWARGCLFGPTMEFSGPFSSPPSSGFTTPVISILVGDNSLTDGLEIVENSHVGSESLMISGLIILRKGVL